VAADAARFDSLLSSAKQILTVEENMDRLQFILGSLQRTAAEHSEMIDEMLAIAIRSEIASLMPRTAAAFSVIDTYMIQTRPMAA
jgi:hypothetical protein